MKKSLLFITSLVALLSLTACGGTPKDESKPASDESKESTPKDSEESTPKESEESQESETTPLGPKKTITYRSWDYGTEGQENEERELIKEFEKRENVIVKIAEDPGSGNAYWDGIKASIATGIDLADVMMVPNLDWPLSSQYLLNIKEMAEADPDFMATPSSVRDACSFKSGIYAVPARMNLQGYFVNTTLVGNKLGIATRNLNVNSSYEDIEAIINAAAATNDVVGLDAAAHFIDTMASVLDETGEMGYFTWDGSEYHLDSTAFTTGVQKAKELFEAKKVLAAYEEEDRAALGLDPEVDPTVDAWNKAKLALRYGYTYEIPDMVRNNTLNQSYKFIGNPGGKIAIVGDYYGIYVGTKEPELAYKFAKWMSFGMDGFKKRMDLYEPSGTINSLPLSNDEELLEDYFARFGSSSMMSGLEEAYEYIQTKSMVEGVKVVPGYLSARQNKKTGVKVGAIDNATMFELLDACYKGGLNITDYTSGEVNIDTIADKTYTDWIRRYGDFYD